ncbi:uncharacterized protein [Pyxicephalus adspersus]|uniref:uncharacterized protein n=1 Tax=Pyxicephalus adspersus TaxID=30357 RepID=UPI003B5B9667
MIMNKEIIAVLVFLCGLFEYKACVITAENKPKPCANKLPGESSIATPAVVMQSFSIMNGRCGCFDYSGETIVYNPQKKCDSILLCRMLHNMVIMQNLHLNMIVGTLRPCSQPQSQVQDQQPSVTIVKDQNNQMSVTDSQKHTNISTSCLSKLLQEEVPSLLLKLQRLLCLFQQGKDEHNEALYKEFLKQLNMVLKEAGCSLDEVLGTTNILEQITDNAGKIADRLVYEVLKVADDLKLTGKLLNVVCNLLGKTLTSLSDILANINLNLDLGLKSIGGLLG